MSMMQWSHRKFYRQQCTGLTAAVQLCNESALAPEGSENLLLTQRRGVALENAVAGVRLECARPNRRQAGVPGEQVTDRHTPLRSKVDATVDVGGKH